MLKHQANSLPPSIRRRRRWGLVLEIIIFPIITGLILIDLVPAVLSLLGHKNQVPASPAEGIPVLLHSRCDCTLEHAFLTGSSSEGPGSPADASGGGFRPTGRLEFNAANNAAIASHAEIV